MFTARANRRFYAALIVWAAVGCSDSKERTGFGLPDAVDAAGDTISFGDSATADSTTVSDAMGPADTASGDTQDVGPTAPPPCEGDGLFNCPCASNDDCDSGYCVEGPEGSICSEPCLENCPAGFSCAQTGEGGDLIYLCIPTTTTLCQPCEKDSDCDHLGIAKGAAHCIAQFNGNDQSDGGAFCGAPCGQGLVCPAGFSCQSLTIDGQPSEQCVPTGSTTCKCNGWGVQNEASTPCSITNSEGTCFGSRTCGPQGLSLCSASTPTAETCNGFDDNCDGQTDENIVYIELGVAKKLGTPCGVGACTGGLVICDPQGATDVSSGAVCDSAGKASEETCNLIDDDCNGLTDENLSVTDSKCADVGVCKSDKTGAFCEAGQWQCNYNAVLDYEANSELTCDGKDNDCDGLTDEDFVYGSASATVSQACDGVGECGSGTVECAPDGAGIVCSTDALGSASQALTETCDNLDNDCDGTTDEGCDDDGDQFCDANMTIVGSPTVCPKGGGDCDDKIATTNPKGTEVCNDLDDDCDGKTDTACDADGDGFCNKNATVKGAPKVCFNGSNDCDDSNAKVNPAAPEVCNNLDDDCDGKTDAADKADLEATAPFCAKQDGVCNGSRPDASLCQGGAWKPCSVANYKANNSNYDPGAQETLCDNLDNNCDGVADAKCDADGDGYCNEKYTVVGKVTACPAGGGDCNDNKAKINPSKQEICDALATDENCNGQVEEPGAANCANYYLDNDGDGYGVKSVKPKCLCSADFNSKHTSTFNTDCNDDNKKVYPSAKETCATPYDDDCDGGNNDINALGCKSFYTDVDGDNYGDKKIPPVCLCNPIFNKKLTATKSGDCADQSSAVNPGKQESCLTAYDDNCNGQTNDIGAIGCGNFYKDSDKDGFGASGTKPVCLCVASASLKLTALNGKDCDDGNKNINPNATEVCATAGVDDNCDGKKDPPGTKGCSSFYFDGDGDGYAQSNSTSVCQCGPNSATKFTAKKKGDCNDTSTAIKPGATEMCNGIDDDCDKVKDEGATSQCKSVSNASHACASGKCSITKCSSKYFDLDKAYSNGCECKADGYYGVNGNACTKPTSMGTFVDTSKTRKTITANLVPGENDHWFYASTIDAKDVASCDNYDVRIKFTSNPGGKFQFDVYRGGCGGDKQLCKDETAHTYRTDFWGNAYGPGIKKAGKAGECKCTTAAKTLPGYNKCTSQSAGYYIRVHYKKGVAPTCSSFTLEFSNGYY